LQENLGGCLVNDRAVVLRLATGGLEGPGGGDGCEAFVPIDNPAGDSGAQLVGERAAVFRGGSERAIHVPGDADDDGEDSALADELGNPRDRIGLSDVDGFERVRKHSEVVTKGEADPRLSGVHPEKSFRFHLRLKIQHSNPTLRNTNMPNISVNKFGENLPVTSVVALSQVAVGFGVGLLLADKMDRRARNITAIAVISSGAAVFLPLIVGIVSTLSNRPDSSRNMERKIAGIRRSTAPTEGHETL